MSTSYATRTHAEPVVTTQGARLEAPAATRNASAIAAALRSRLPRALDDEQSPIFLLELGSGTGQHASHLVSEFDCMVVQPSDADAAARASCDAYRAALPPAAAARMGDAVALDICAPDAAPPPCRGRGTGDAALHDVVLCVNVLHIAPREATTGVARLAALALRHQGILAIYGPFTVDGRPTTDSNAAFDAKLRAMNAAYGLRDIADVVAACRDSGLEHLETVAMPANNFFLFFRRR